MPRAGGRRRLTVTVGAARRLRCDARSGVAPRNSLRERCSLRSNRRGESEHEGRCARRPRSWPCRPRRALRPGRSQGTSRPPDGSCPCSPSRRHRGAPPAPRPRHCRPGARGRRHACPCERTWIGASSPARPQWRSRLARPSIEGPAGPTADFAPRPLPARGSCSAAGLRLLDAARHARDGSRHAVRQDSRRGLGAERTGSDEPAAVPVPDQVPGCHCPSTSSSCGRNWAL